jgi:hypothetical protein
MLWILFTAPLMLIALTAALVPVLVTMIRDERARLADRRPLAAMHGSTAGAYTDTDEIGTERRAA